MPRNCFVIVGTNRKQGAIGKTLPFSDRVYTFTWMEAMEVAREARYDLGFEHVHISVVRFYGHNDNLLAIHNS